MTDWTRDEDPAAVWDDEWHEDDHEHAEGEWEHYREPRGGGCARKLLVSLLVLVVVGAIGGFVAWSWVQDQVDPPGEPTGAVEVEIATGSTTEDIGQILEDHGVISSAMVWDYWTRFKGAGPFQAGFYDFQENMAFREAVAVLDGGPRPPQFDRVTIPEGLTVSEILPRLADPETGVEGWSLEALQGALQSGEIRSQYQPPEQTSMEGLLFPDTYEIDLEETDEAAFLRRLVAETDARLTALDVEAKAAALGRSPYEILVIASLIEEESRVPEERPKVARVIYNRLEQGIPLGIDATSRYEAEINGRSREDLDFESDSPYNTRRVAGIPPTPIAAAGQASLEAALNPAEGDWIYYVLQDEEGNHFFTASFDEFNQAKRECAEKGLGCG
ncbi:MAG TPA: endolytic transglycosylase MltG [Acidimicrobiales bacterium]|nr:endolytic transglycosylase MltG [Acidimicrobiales bacterium]